MRKINYKGVLIGLGVVLSLLVTTIIYYLRYPIDENNHNLREGTVNFVHPTNDWNSLTIYNSVSFDNKKYVLAQFDNQLGQIDLVKGIHGRYRIESIGYGTGNFRYKVEESNNKKYLVFGGKNPDFLISEISFTLDSKDYSINVPHSEYFLICLEVDNTIQSYYPEANSIKFYTATGQDITDKIEL